MIVSALVVGAIGLALWAVIFTLPPIGLLTASAGKPISVSPALLVLPGILIGGSLLALPLALASIGAWTPSQYLRALAGFAVLALLCFGLVWAVRFNGLSAVKAALAVPLGAITLLLAVNAIDAVRSNDGISFETHWGGLGGGLGGWRLSTAAVLTGLLLLFASATVSVVLYEPSKDHASTPPPASHSAEKAKDQAK